MVSIPLDGASTRVTLAGMDVEDWDSLVLYVGPRSGQLFRRLRGGSFAVVEGSSSISRSHQGDGEQVSAHIAFEHGELHMSAAFSCREMPFHRQRVSVGTGKESFSMFFGQIAGSECATTDVSVQLTGTTPFSDLDLSAVGATASLATGVRWDYKLLRNAEF